MEFRGLNILCGLVGCYRASLNAAELDVKGGCHFDPGRLLVAIDERSSELVSLEGCDEVDFGDF